MNLISGTVHQITDGTVKTGRSIGKAYKNVMLTTGNKLTAFDISFVAGVEVGKEYTFPVEQSGQYINIVGAVIPVIQTESVDSEKPEFSIAKEIEKETHVKMYPVPSKDIAIRKAVALKASVEFLIGLHTALPEKFSVGDVIETAKKFEEYLA